MKNVYFVQVGFEFDGSVYLPYGVGTIIAYCKDNEKIKSEYDFPDIIYQREKLNDALQKLKSPYVVGFSCSVWNMEYNKALAKKIKEKYPETFIVFGGHSVSENDCSILEEGYADCLMFGEGEETFASLLCNLSDGTFDSVKNIAYKDNGRIVKTERKCPESIEDYPSPYLTGVFDELLKKHQDTEFLGVLETNRGCPYSCSYCDWCSDKKLRFFPIDKVLKEIEWLSENKIGYCFGADSNFGMFERDYEIAVALVEVKKKNGYPQVFRPCYEKNSDERVFRICSLLNSVGMDKGATMAYQTLSDAALANIGRKNLTLEHFSSLMKKYTEAGIPTYSELILGLPGETAESFCKGICTLFENGQHNSLSVYHCEILPNAELAQPQYMEKHKIEVMKVSFNHIHSAPKEQEEIKEYSYLVRSTATMNRDDWVYANLFSICIQCFHSLGLLRFFAMYLYTEKGITYYEFYTKLLQFIMNSKGKLGDMWREFKSKYENSLKGDWNYYNKDFGNVTWFFEEGAFLEIVHKYDCCFEELNDFLSQYKDDISEELLRYQKLIVRKPFESSFKTEFSYDFYGYFNELLKGNHLSLENRKTVLNIHPNKIYTDLATFAKEVVWFGRRRGATIYGGSDISAETFFER